MHMHIQCHIDTPCVAEKNSCNHRPKENCLKRFSIKAEHDYAWHKLYLTQLDTMYSMYYKINTA